MTGAAELHALERDLEACLGEVVRLARSSTSTTRAEWQALVQSLTGSRVVLPPARGGANPAEMRTVLIAIETLYEQRLQMLERGLTREARAEIDDAIWTFRHRRLSSLVREELAVYTKLAAPPPSIASLFAQAAGEVTAPAAVESRAELHRCQTCGAPRCVDGLYGNCLYCGHAFFNPRQEIES